jgi:hypothetical protein
VGPGIPHAPAAGARCPAQAGGRGPEASRIHEPEARCRVAGLLKDGYKQSGASAETMTAMEDRVIQAFPHSEEAYDIVYERWKKAHKEPEDQKDAAAWKSTTWSSMPRSRVGLPSSPNTGSATYRPGSTRFPTIRTYPRRKACAHWTTTSRRSTDYQRPGAWNYLNAASFLMDHKWQPERAIELARSRKVGRRRPRDQSQRQPLFGGRQERKEQEIYLDQNWLD